MTYLSQLLERNVPVGYVGLQVRISALRELFKTFYGLIAVEEVSYDSQEHPNPPNGISSASHLNRKNTA